MRFKVDYVQDDKLVLYSSEYDSYFEIPKFLCSDLGIGNIVDVSVNIKFIAKYEPEQDEIMGGFRKIVKKQPLED